MGSPINQKEDIPICSGFHKPPKNMVLCCPLQVVPGYCKLSPNPFELWVFQMGKWGVVDPDQGVGLETQPLPWKRICSRRSLGLQRNEARNKKRRENSKLAPRRLWDGVENLPRISAGTHRKERQIALTTTRHSLSTPLWPFPVAARTFSASPFLAVQPSD